jgi:Ca-activated chloride channel homolog
MRLPTPLVLGSLVVAGCGGAPPAPDPAASAGVAVAADPGLISLAADPTADLVLADAATELAVRIRVTADTIRGARRPPVNLTLVLDTSGSMEGEAIAAARGAARALIERMRDGDRVAVVTFHSTAAVLVPSSVLAAGSRREIDAKLAAIEARGTTAMADGLALGVAQAIAGQREGAIDRIVLLGDGVPNDAAPIPATIAQARAARISITTLGLGIDFDPLLLGTIARDTGGVYRYLDEPTAVAEVFERELLRMRQVAARNLQLRLRPGPGVTVTAVPGLPALGPGAPVVLGDLAAGEHRDVIVTIAVDARRDRAVVELLDAVLTFEDAIGGSGDRERTAYASARASVDAGAVAASVRTDITVARSLATAAGAILHAIAVARAGEVERARAILDAAEAEARAAAEVTGDAELLGLAAQMAALRPHLSELVQVVLAGDVPRLERAPAPAAERVLREVHGGATRVLDPR